MNYLGGKTIIIKIKSSNEVADLLKYVSLCSEKLMLDEFRRATNHCFNKSLSTAPALASADTGTGVKEGRASEMGFIRR